MKLPSRYEDLNDAYKGRLIPNQDLISMIQKANNSIKINGGIRFMPIFGQSGSGKSCCSIELQTHLPNVYTFLLNPKEIENKEELLKRILAEEYNHKGKILIPIIDQFEENVSGKEKIPTQFVEYISVLDRNELKDIPVIFLWLTTSKEFQKALSDATRRNSRILISPDFEVRGPAKDEWTSIIKTTFALHNNEKTLEDYLVIDSDIDAMVFKCDTIGKTIEGVSEKLAESLEELENFSEYQIILLWPVADSVRNQKVMQYALARDGYRLNWDAFYRELNEDDKKQLPLDIYNRTRLYFDFRIIPFRAADLHRLCSDLDKDDNKLGKTYLTRFSQTHFYHVLIGNWENYAYSPVRETESTRSKEASDWYKTITNKPTLLGRRISRILKELGLDAYYEKELKSEYSTVKADVFVEKTGTNKKKIIIEMKVYSSENTVASTIKEQIKVTLRRHALFSGFMKKN